MKKVLLAAATVAMLFATSCKKDLNAPENIQLGENEFLATIDNGAVPQNAPALRDGMGTMTTIDGERRVFWESGDQITINGVTATAKTNGNPVIFEPEGTVEGNNYHAFYPADIQTGYTDDYGNLPAEQTYYGVTSGQTDVRNLPMYALGGENKLLTFHNICSVLKISVPSYAAGADKIVISSDQRMNGLFKIGGDYAAVMQNEPQSEDDKKVTMKPLSTLNDGKFAENAVVYIAVPAQEYTKFKVEFFNGDNSVWCKTLASCTLAVNTVYPITMSEMPNGLCFTAAAPNCTVTFNNILNLTLDNGAVIQCSTDGTNWVNYTGSITLANEGDKVYFRASADHNTAFGGEPGAHFSFAGDVKASGNIMSLYGPNCPDDKTLPSYAFASMFQNCSTLITAPELPATKLSRSCYQYMFSNCSGLQTAPALPAQVVNKSAYYAMFYNCESLTDVPKISADTVGEQGFNNMFTNCVNLVNVPVTLPAKIADESYAYMFNGCFSLTEAPALPSMNLATSCYSYMFMGCSSLQEAPALPATTMADYCYQSMFENCSLLERIEVGFAKFDQPQATDATYNWTKNVAAEGEFIAPNMAIEDRIYSIANDNYIPFGWQVVTEE